MFNWINTYISWRIERKAMARYRANRWYIACGAPCHDREFWITEKGYY